MCGQVVPPLGGSDPEKATNGHTADTDATLLPIESRTCPGCRTRLERTPPGTWRAGRVPRLTGDKSRRRFRRPA